MKRLAYLLIVLTALSACGQERLPETCAPVAKKMTRTAAIHGHQLNDDYYWMRNRKSPEVMQYIEAENDYTASVTGHLKRLEAKLYGEMVRRIKENDTSVPEKDGSYLYYSKQKKGAEYSVYYRRPDVDGGREEVILDLNKLAEGHDYFDVGMMKVSPDEQLLAYTYDIDGSENYRLAVKRISDSAMIEERDIVIDDFEWLNDNRTYLYTVRDKTSRPYKVIRNVLGENADTELYTENDGKYWMWLSRSKDDEYVFLGLGSKTTSEMRFMPAGDTAGDFTLFAGRKSGVEYYLSHDRGRFYIFTNEDALNFKIMTASDTAFRDRSAWKTLMAHDKNRTIMDYDIFSGHLAIYIREGGFKKILITDHEGKNGRYVEFPEDVCDYYTGKNAVYDTDTLRFTYESMITPPVVFDYNMDTGAFKELKKRKVRGYDKRKYETRRLYAKAQDGTYIPLTLVYCSAVRRAGVPTPLYLYGYGAYGDSMDPYFSSSRLSLLDRGVTFAIAHVRGGGEMGKAWYEEGKLLKKKNSFTDFIACAEYLVAEGWTSPDLLAASGGSAGGLLMGAVTNMRPDLFKVVVASVPFVDVINTMMDPTIPLTVAEYEEWGNPAVKKYFEYMLSYSPYDNIARVRYPNMLITGGLNDPRVQYWEPLKWTAKLRDRTSAGDNLIILRINTGAGHMGASGRYGWLHEIAFEYAFVLDRLGL